MNRPLLSSMSAAPTVTLPAERLTALNDVPADPSRGYVLYWCVMARRTRYNFALEYALARAAAWGRPLVVLEALRAGYPWASDRLHRFALDGTADDAAAYADAGVAHYAYVEPEDGADRGLLGALAERGVPRRHRRVPGVLSAAHARRGGPNARRGGPNARRARRATRNERGDRAEGARGRVHPALHGGAARARGAGTAGLDVLPAS